MVPVGSDRGIKLSTEKIEEKENKKTLTLKANQESKLCSKLEPSFCKQDNDNLRLDEQVMLSPPMGFMDLQTPVVVA